MRTRSWLLVVAGWVAGAWLPVLAGPSCIDATIRINTGHTKVILALTLPEGTHAIPLKPLDGYQRTQLWHSPDRSATITDSELRAADPGQRHLRVTMDVGANVDRPDRTYPPFLRFADGTVAVETDAFAAAEHAMPLCLRFVPAAGEQVIGYGAASSRLLLAPSAPAPAAYVAFGTPSVERDRSLLLVSGGHTPVWIRRRLRNTITGIARFYRQRMGPRELPTVFFYRLANSRGSGYHGDRLPGSLTLGLIGKAWDTPQPSAAHQITEFVGHEMFHVWNAADDMEPLSAESNLASEGGAELATMFAGAYVEGKGEQAWLAEASASLNECLLALPATGSLVAAHLDHGLLPYHCGVPVMLVLAALNNPQDPSNGYFRAWKKLIESKRAAKDRHYRWTDLAPPGVNPAIMSTLVRAAHGDGAYASAIQQALAQAGFLLQAPASLSAHRQPLNMRLMQTLMAHDCGGRVSFWSKPDGFLLDHPLPGCHSLRGGKTVVSLLGHSLASDRPRVLIEAIKARCDAGGKVDVGYADATKASELDCPTSVPTLPELFDIVAYHPQSPAQKMRGAPISTRAAY